MMAGTTKTALTLTVTQKSCALQEAELQGDWEKTHRGAFLSMLRYTGFGMHNVIIRKEAGTRGTTPVHPRVPGVTDWLAELSETEVEAAWLISASWATQSGQEAVEIRPGDAVCVVHPPATPPSPLLSFRVLA